MDAERKEFLEEDPEIGNAYTGVAISLTDMIKNTLELQQVLEAQSPINAEKGVDSAPKRRRIQVSDSDLNVTWTAVQSSWSSLEPTLMNACDEVHRRATVRVLLWFQVLAVQSSCCCARATDCVRLAREEAAAGNQPPNFSTSRSRIAGS